MLTARQLSLHHLFFISIALGLSPWEFLHKNFYWKDVDFLPYNSVWVGPVSDWIGLLYSDPSLGEHLSYMGDEQVSFSAARPVIIRE